MPIYFFVGFMIVFKLSSDKVPLHCLQCLRETIPTISPLVCLCLESVFWKEYKWLLDLACPIISQCPGLPLELHCLRLCRGTVSRWSGQGVCETCMCLCTKERKEKILQWNAPRSIANDPHNDYLGGTCSSFPEYFLVPPQSGKNSPWTKKNNDREC